MNDVLTKPFRRVDLARVLELWLQGVQVDGQCLEGEVGFMRCEVEDPGEAIDRADFDSMRGQLGEDFPELLDAFRESAEDILGQMTDAMAGPAGEDITMLAHSLKSCSANVGAMHLSRLARDLEASAESGGPWSGKIDTLRAEYQKGSDARWTHCDSSFDPLYRRLFVALGDEVKIGKPINDKGGCSCRPHNPVYCPRVMPTPCF